MSNYQYIRENYVLSEWFNYNDIDWFRYYPMKNDKMYACNTKRTIAKMILEEKRGHTIHIYDDDKVNIHNIFVKYLGYINGHIPANYITDKDMKKLLDIKVYDCDLSFMWSNPIYDKNSKELLLKIYHIKIINKNNNVSIIFYKNVIIIYKYI